MEPIGVIRTAHLLPGLHRHLVEVLQGLTAEDWVRPTLARGWRVRDVAAHLLDGDIRRLSFQRDGLPIPAPEEPVSEYADLVRFLNTLNAEWIRASARVSPRLLVQFLELTGPQVAELLTSLDPHDRAFFPVAWADQPQSESWFDVGREYTERWHHQAQIREAVGAPLLDAREWLQPVLELSMSAFCRGFKDVHDRPGTAFVIEIDGEAGGTWSIVAAEPGWSAWRGRAADASARVRLDAGTAWRLFFNALSEADARARVVAEGDARFTDRFLSVRAVMV